MENKLILEFASKVIKYVRDYAIQNNDALISEDNKNVKSIKWKDLLNSGNMSEFQRTIIVDIIDDVIFYLLDAIDNKLLNLNYISDDNTSINLSEKGLGELAGYYAGNDWIKTFSKERFIDYLSDLNTDFK